MKKLIPISIFTTIFSGLVGMFCTCIIHFVGICFAIGLDGKRVIDEYPRFIPFIIIVGFLSCVAIVGVLIFNIKFSKKLAFTKKMWIIQSVCTFILSFPFTYLWLTLFSLLRKVF